MRLCSKRKLDELLQRGQLSIVSEAPVIFLDGFRIGLRAQDLLETPEGTVDLQKGETPKKSRALSERGMARGEWGLGRSIEKLSFGPTLIGFMNTRSKYARLGLEMMGSSWIVAPGFGGENPTEIIFEMTAHNDLRGFRTDESYVSLMVFELDESVVSERRVYGNRFPF